MSWRCRSRFFRAWYTDAIETIPIDDALLSGNGNPETTRFGVPRLGFGRDRPHLDESKPHVQQACHGDAILVETRAQAQRRLEFLSPARDAKRRIVGAPVAWEEAFGRRKYANVVRLLGVQQAEEGPQGTHRIELERRKIISVDHECARERPTGQKGQASLQRVRVEGEPADVRTRSKRGVRNTCFSGKSTHQARRDRHVCVTD